VGLGNYTYIHARVVFLVALFLLRTFLSPGITYVDFFFWFWLVSDPYTKSEVDHDSNKIQFDQIIRCILQWQTIKETKVVGRYTSGFRYYHAHCLYVTFSSTNLANSPFFVGSLARKSSFSVDIEDNLTVSHLKDAIVKKKPVSLANVEADELDLSDVSVDRDVL
jgi:hypothetical protein